MRGHPRAKAGRNEPCPCGSGKKFKQCCLEKAKAEDSLWQQVHAAFVVVQSEISKFGSRQFGDLVEFAWSDYQFGEPGGPLEEAALPLFVPYFIYRWRPARKKKLPTGDSTIAHAYLRLHDARLSELERQVVELGLSQPVTFYEVRSAIPGQEFVLKELFTGKESLVKERSGSKNVRPGDIFYGQLAPMRGITTMAYSASFLIPPGMKPDIVMLRRSIQDDKRGAALKTKDVLQNEDDIRALFFYLRDRLYKPPVLQNTDDEPLVLQTIRYEVGSAQVAFDALAPLNKSMTKEDLLQNAEHAPDGSLQKVTIQWLKTGNRRIKSWDNTVLATIHISGRSLKAEVNSENRASKLCWEIEKRLGLAAVYKGTEVIPVDLEKIRRKASAPPETGDLMKDPEARRLVRETMQKQVDCWVRERIPALGGLTPLQAVKSADGREMVEALVVDYERTLVKSFPEGMRPDMSTVRRRLKLPPAQGDPRSSA